jgi:hypothetical protein
MQQKRDKTRSQSAADDAHRGIPRDAKGDPIFLILPPVMRARYDKQMAQCESAWRKGELLAVAEAAVRSQLYRQPIPAWLADAIVELAVKRRTPKQAKQYREAQKDLARYILVRDLKVGIPGHYEPIADLTWEEAYAEASCMLEGTLAKGGEDTMKRAYEDVRNDLKAGHSGKYLCSRIGDTATTESPTPTAQLSSLG